MNVQARLPHRRTCKAAARTGRHSQEAHMFNFRNDRGGRSRGSHEAQRREGGQPERRRDERLGSGSEDWGQEWGEDWRGEDNGQGSAGRGSQAPQRGGAWYQQDTPAGQRRGSWGEQGYGAADTGGTGHPYSSGYGGYRPNPQDSGYRSQERESGYGYRDEDRFGPRGRSSELGPRDEGYGRARQGAGEGRGWRGEDERRERSEWGERGGRAMHWREGMERDREERAGQPSYGGGYFGDAGRGGQSYSGGQRVYPDDPGYHRRTPYAEQAGQGSRHAGRRAVGPKGYHRPDERVREDVCERLAMNPYIDVGEVTVEVANGVVTLDGTVRERREKYVIEEIADAVFGVTEVDNRLRVQRQSGSAWAAGSEVGGDETLGGRSGSLGTSGTGGTGGSTSGTASGTSPAGTSPDRTLNKS
ncbi:hypothetical protein N234_33195 [Ralstonia pickettii DTP0602]|nr:hypothetical protein N234_33195 [Ralstonia pickettii DTP0602]